MAARAQPEPERKILIAEGLLEGLGDASVYDALLPVGEGPGPDEVEGMSDGDAGCARDLGGRAAVVEGIGWRPVEGRTAEARLPIEDQYQAGDERAHHGVGKKGSEVPA